jgi:hypothetical protein
MRREVLFAALLISFGAQWSFPANVPIANAGFEDVALTCTAGPFCVAGNVGAWTGTGQFFTFMPSVGSGGEYPNGIPEGVNVAALGNNSGSGVLVQTLGITLQPNTTYTLTFSVGSRVDYPFTGYGVELLAGSITVASDSSLAPASGTFAPGRIVYTTGANPPLLGQTLGIRLTGNAPGQADFDKISLDATQTTTTSSSISQIASGAGWKTTMTIVNLSPGPNSISVNFRGDAGSPLILPVVVTQQGSTQSATTSSVNGTLGPGATLLIESEAPVSSNILVGWAEVLSSAPVSGFSIFRLRGQDGRDSEGTASLGSGTSSDMVLPYDNTAGFATGVALVNLTTDPVIVNAVIRDDSGTQIGLQAVALSGKAHTSFFLSDRFSITSGRRGTIEFQNTSGGAVTGIGLRFNPSGSFTSVPTIAR